ncbi:hypothetical protein J4412_02090 [Candidatus Pacearchaeota archaeon]|nr:hypothetical protein [Candidatus Pacearchaeota archaeon]HIH52565.1 hypothetical protein [Nanoarchaeota archaeon]
MSEKESGIIPKILEERLLITPEDRILLKVASELSPHDNGKLLITSSILDNYVPSISKIAEKTGKTNEEVKESFERISKVWNIPSESLPKNNGYYSDEEALTNALVNQHKLRWNPNLNDYSVTKMHWISGEMGTGTLFTNNVAFLGEKIVRQAMNVDSSLVSYHMQGGIMPDIVTLFGKAKNKRAIMTGLNKSSQDIDDRELASIVQRLNLLNAELGRPTLSKKSIKNLEKYVVNTVNSMEEAAESVGFELADQVKNLESFAELHLYWSYNDDYNQSEIEDKNIAILRDIHKRMRDAEEKLPYLKKELDEQKEEMVKSEINSGLTNKYYNFLMKKKNSSKNGDFKESGKEFKSYTSEFFETKDGKRKYSLDKKLRRELKDKAKKLLGREFEAFDSFFEDEWNRFYNLETSMKQVSNHREGINKKLDKLEKEIQNTQHEFDEAKSFESSQRVEDMEGHAWFTKKIAITPTEAKGLETIKKEVYKGLYEDILIPSIKKYSNRPDLKIYLHTDDIISVEVADPQHTIEGKKDFKNRPVGTIFTSLPRVNSQSSNEPLATSFSQVQSFHEGEISNAVASGKQRPKTKGELDKRDFAHTDVYISSHGADGYLSQRKFTIDPTTIQGEYAKNAHITAYIKVPTRQDLSKLAELMIKGNKGTWNGKRLAKGGTIAGSVLLIEHADGSPEEIFFDDRYFKNVALTEIEEDGKKITIGEKYNSLEKKIFESTDNEELERLEKERFELLEKIKPVIGRIFLQNDLHCGAYSTPGRPSNTDIITSSQLAAVQTYGVNGFEMSLMSEALHGALAYRSYDSKRESATNSDTTHTSDPISFMKNLKKLELKMKSQGASDKEVLEYIKHFTEEFVNGVPSFKPEDQKNIFREILYPINVELMENGVPLLIGTGNHWMGMKDAEDEASVIASILDGSGKYQEQGLLLRGQGASGQSFNYDYFKLPSLDGKGIDSVFAHKMEHGKTEIDQMAHQAIRTRSSAKYYFAADRHQPGAMAQGGKMGVLDVGKQTTIPYAKMIGKAASVNGHMVAGYGKNNELLLSARYFLNPTVDEISGWDYKAEILIKARSLILEAAKDDSIAREAKRLNFLIEKSNIKVGELEKKLGRPIFKE